MALNRQRFLSKTPWPILFPTIALSLLFAGVAVGSPVVATVESRWAFDPDTRLYTYSFVITNLPTSPNVLSRFGIRPTSRPVRTSSPKGWTAFRGWQRDSSAVVWAVTDPGPEPANWNGQLLIGPYDLAPGRSATGFQILSDQPPDSAGYFIAQGFDTIPGGAHTWGPKPPRLRTLWEQGWVARAIVPRLDRGGRPLSRDEVAIDSMVVELLKRQHGTSVR